MLRPVQSITTRPPAPDARRMVLVLLCVSIPSFMINLDANIVAVSLSSIARALKADFAAIEWVISAYTLTFAALVLPAGALADRYGRKRMLIAGLTIFTLASILCGAARSVGMLNGARALQGVGAALQLSAALATLSHVFRGAARARAFAVWGSVIGIAIALGPVVGGLITQFAGWQWAFYVNVPVGAAMIGLTLYAVEESRDPDAGRVDLAGFATFSGFLFLATLALISGNREGWASLPIRVEGGVAALLFVAFLVVEMRQARPMLDLGFFRRPTYVGASVAAVAFAAALLTMLTYLPIYLQNGLGIGPLRAGLLMMPMAVPLFVVPRLVAVYLSPVLSGRDLLAGGLLIVAAGLGALALAAPLFDYRAMIAGMLLAGTGAGVLNGEVAKVGMSVIPPERAGMASGVGGTLRFSGIVLGFAALGALLYDRIAATVVASTPLQTDADRLDLIRRVGAGHLSGPQHDLAQQSYGSGYQAILLAAAAFAAISSITTFALVRAAETAPATPDAAPIAPVE